MFKSYLADVLTIVKIHLAYLLIIRAKRKAGAFPPRLNRNRKSKDRKLLQVQPLHLVRREFDIERG